MRQIKYPKELDFSALEYPREFRNSIARPNAAIELDDIVLSLQAIEKKVGVDNSIDTFSLDYRINGIETIVANFRFTSLIDTPSSYNDYGGYIVAVKSDCSGLEFIVNGGGTTTFLGLTDTPSSYSGAGGYFVKVNSGGTALEFVAGSAASHVLLSATHTDTLADTVVAGDMIIGNATPKWARLAKGSDGNFLKMASGYPAWSAHGLTYSDVGAEATITILPMSKGGTSVDGSAFVNAEFLGYYALPAPGIYSSGYSVSSFALASHSHPSTDITDWGTYINQAVLTTSSPTFVNLTITSFASNWTNAGRTVADLGIVTTIDINGGSIDGTVIGANSAAYGTFSAVTITSADYGLNLLDSGSAFYLKIVSDSTPLLTANRVLTFDVTDVARTVTLSGSPTLGDWFDQSVKTTASPTFAGLTVDSPTLVVDAINNRVGIGTASPAWNLHISSTTDDIYMGCVTGGTSKAVYFYMTGTHTTWGGIRLAFGGTANLTFLGNRGGTAGNFTIYQWRSSAYQPDFTVDVNGNIGLGTTSFGTSAAKVLAIGNGTAPSTAPADAIQMWSADYAAGDARMYLKTESGTANIVLGNDQIVTSPLVKCVITVGGSVTARTFTVNVRKYDGVAGTNSRYLVHWWVSTSEYGSPAQPGIETYEVTTGQELAAEVTNNVNHAVTDASGDMVLTATTAKTTTPLSIYFHIEVQGILYTANGTINTGPPS